jgi:hypothetical protein
VNIAGYAIAPMHVAMPPQRAGRKARLPTVAAELARRAVGEHSIPENAAIFFGTTYGAETETEAFVENMILHEEQFPKPRAFSASVHNSMATRIAIELGVRGTNRTYVQAEHSFQLALRAAARVPIAIVGSLDESTELLRRGHTEFGDVLEGEGGAVLYAHPDGAMARIRLDGPADIWIQPIAHYPGAIASTTALAVGVVHGDIEPQQLGLADRPESIGIRSVSRHLERSRIVVEQLG